MPPHGRPTWTSRRTRSLPRQRRCCRGFSESMCSARSAPALAAAVRLAGVTSPAPGGNGNRCSCGHRPGRAHRRHLRRGPAVMGAATHTGGGPAAVEGHVPVMAAEGADLLAPALDAEGAVLVDATLGRAGHARALLDAPPGLGVIGMDMDQTAIEESQRLLAPYASRSTLVHARYDELAQVLAGQHLSPVQGILFDLGGSSPPRDDRDRGFAYSYDAPLDMRMDVSRPLTAADVVNTYPVERLAAVLREFGEERFAGRIARALVRQRAVAPLSSTGQLTEIISASIPAPARRTGGNPAKRTFQALRIEVNGELEALSRVLPLAMDALTPGGRIVVLAYHSLEDRIVKRTITERTTDTTPRGLPQSLPGRRPLSRRLTRSALRPTEEEVAATPRAASARLRAAERIDEAA